MDAGFEFPRVRSLQIYHFWWDEETKSTLRSITSTFASVIKFCIKGSFDKLDTLLGAMNNLTAVHSVVIHASFDSGSKCSVT